MLVSNGADHCVAVGTDALVACTNGDYSVAIGSSAGNALTGGNKCTLIGYNTDASASDGTNQTVIGYDAQGQGDNTVTLGDGNVDAVYMADDKGATVYCAGVSFQHNQPAAGSGTSSHEVLDHYEEGVHTMTITGTDGGNFVLSSTYNKVAYTKIGRLVHMQGYISADSDNSTSGVIKFSMPFTVGSGDGDEGYGATALLIRSHGGTFNSAFVKTLEGNAYFHLMKLDADGTDTSATHAHVDAAWSFYLNMTYYAAT